jgi:hypothetical protein
MVCFETLGLELPQRSSRKSEGIATGLRSSKRDATFSELRRQLFKVVTSGLPRRNPELEFAIAFSDNKCRRLNGCWHKKIDTLTTLD